MSRIDEALKRASQGPHSSRSSSRSDAPLRLADEVTLNEYPLENSRTSPARAPYPDIQLNEVVPAAVPKRPEPRRAAPTVGAPASGVPASEKLVVGRARNKVSTEQYRRLAATLHDAQADKGLKSVMVTSAVPREGKTLTIVNLALTLSESYGKTVILIDADLRRPSVHEVLGLANERGLSDVLRSDRLEPPIVQVSPTLAVLPSGRPDQNPLAGLSSERMLRLLETLTAQYDWVLLDTPPVGLLSDAQVLGRLAQAAIFVIRAGATPFEVVNRAIDELGRDCIIGTVLNGVEQDSLPARGYYGEYYGHD